MAQEKKVKIALFLGAGASKPFDKPTTVELRNNLTVKYSNLANRDNVAGLVYSLVSYEKYEDIEYVLQALKEIVEISRTEGGKYLLDERFGFNIRTPQQAFPARSFLANLPEVKERLESDVFENYRWDHSKDSILSKIHDSLLGLLERRSHTIKVFTTNYDKAIEQYCSSTEKYECADGFDWNQNKKLIVWQNGDYSYLDTRTGKPIVYLYKIHGSLGWKQHKQGFIVNTGEEGISSDPNYKENLLIYPTVSPKDGEEKEPYKTIRSHFENFMKEAFMCIVIGFSFRDQHLNTIFEEFLKNRHILVIVSPSAKKNFHVNFLKDDEYEEEKTAKEKESSSLEVETVTLQNGESVVVRYIKEKLTEQSVVAITKKIEGIIDEIP